MYTKECRRYTLLILAYFQQFGSNTCTSQHFTPMGFIPANMLYIFKVNTFKVNTFKVNT